MRQNTVKMTTAQFAELHGVNRRTLHYYDDIGLFSPCQKGENGYRYYDASQSIVFEYIRMLKELNMSIAEIADYCKHPAPEKFLQIADRKEAEIDLEIRRLKRARNILKTKKRRCVFARTCRMRKSGSRSAARSKFLFCRMIFPETIYPGFLPI